MLRYIGCALLCLVFFGTLGPRVLSAEQPEIQEFEVKAAFIYNFIKFVELPIAATHKDSEIHLCVAGKSRMSSFQQVLNGKLVNDRGIRTVALSEMLDSRDCEVIFIPKELEDWRELLESIRGRGMLSVGEDAEFLDSGGIIRFFLEGSRVRF